MGDLPVAAAVEFDDGQALLERDKNATEDGVLVGSRSSEGGVR